MLAYLASRNLFQPVAIFLLALLLRAMVALRTAVIFNDGPNFIRIAELMNDGRWSEALGHPYHPLYPMLMAALRPIVPEVELAGVMLSVLGGSLAVMALYAFLLAAYGRSLAVQGAFLMALSPYAIRFSADVQSDSVHLAIFLCAVAVLYRALRSGDFWLAFSVGILSGLAYLTRPEGLSVAVVGVFLATIRALRADWRVLKSVRWISSLIIGLAIPTLPYLVSIRTQSGEWSVSGKKSVIELLGLDAEGMTRITVDGLGIVGDPIFGLAVALLFLIGALWFRSWFLGREVMTTVRRVRIGPAAVAAATLTVLVSAVIFAPTQAAEFSSVLVSSLRPELLVLLAFGVKNQFNREPKGRFNFVASFLALHAAVLFALLVQYGYLSRRHALPSVALLMGYAAIGLSTIESSLFNIVQPTWREARKWRPWILGTMLVLLAAIALPKAFHDDRSRELAGRRAAEWLRAQSQEENGLIASKRSKLAYYAGRPWHKLYRNGEMRSLDALSADGVRFVVIERARPVESQPLELPVSKHGGAALVERQRVYARRYEAVVLEVVPIAPHGQEVPIP